MKHFIDNYKTLYIGSPQFAPVYTDFYNQRQYHMSARRLRAHLASAEDMHGELLQRLWPGTREKKRTYESWMGQTKHRLQ